MTDTNWRKIFDDFYVHPTTEGLSLVGRNVFVRLIACGNSYGLLTTAPDILASELACTTDEALAGIHELLDRGSVRWWPERHRLWLIEAASRQCVNASMWVGFAKALLREHPDVRQAALGRYGDVFMVTDHQGTGVPATDANGKRIKGQWLEPPTKIAAMFPELGHETEDKRHETRERDKRQTVCHTVSDTVSPTMPAAPASLSQGSDLDLLCAWAVHGGDPEGHGAWPRARTPEGIEVPAPIVDRERMARWVGEGKFSALDVHRTIPTLARMVEAGSFPAGEYNAGRIFSGHLSDIIPKAAGWTAAQERKAASAPAEITPERLAMLQAIELDPEYKAQMSDAFMGAIKGDAV